MALTQLEVCHLTKRDSFLLRIDPQVLAELRRWADDEMRSINGQIEYVLRESLKQAGRTSKKLREQDTDAKDKSGGEVG